MITLDKIVKNTAFCFRMLYGTGDRAPRNANTTLPQGTKQVSVQAMSTALVSTYMAAVDIGVVGASEPFVISA